ncbi:MAG: NAD(P)/FAD-dependent oxidoreductase [Candidatus Eiseniibacteriota bacterium]
MSLPPRADVVIVGAGCIGASIAYHLAARGVAPLVLEREKMAGTGSTGHCAGGVRQQFSSPVNVRLSKVSIEAFARMKEELEYEGDLYWPVGYLFCLTDPARFEQFERDAAMQKAQGVPVEVLTPADVARRWPVLRTDDLVGATFCPTDGLADPHAVTAAYYAAAKKRGARFEFECELTGIKVTDGRVTAAVTSAGEVATPVIVNAAGPHAASIARFAGVDLPVQPVRRQIFTTQPLGWLPHDFPMVVDMGSRVYMHRESGGLLLGLADRDEPPSFNTNIDFEFRDQVFLLGLERLPRLEEAEYRAGWAGLYEVTPDHNAILGPARGLPGFLLANGFSGHGFMHAPAVGLLIADWVVDGRPSLDVSELSLERFAKRPLPAEANVI